MHSNREGVKHREGSWSHLFCGLLLPYCEGVVSGFRALPCISFLAWHGVVSVFVCTRIDLLCTFLIMAVSALSVDTPEYVSFHFPSLVPSH